MRRGERMPRSTSALVAAWTAVFFGAGMLCGAVFARVLPLWL